MVRWALYLDYSGDSVGTFREVDESRDRVANRITVAKMIVASGGQDGEKRTFSEVKLTGLLGSKETEI